MSVDKTKTIQGPFSLDIFDGTSTSILTAALSGRRKDSIQYTEEIMAEEVEDDTLDEYGRKLKVVVKISEFDPTEHAKFEAETSNVLDGETMEISYAGKSKKMTVTDIKSIKCKMTTDAKTEIEINAVKYGAVGANKPYSIGAIT